MRNEKSRRRAVLSLKKNFRQILFQLVGKESIEDPDLDNAR